MAFMMPVMKNDWDIYNSRRSSESAEKVAGRVRKVSESRSEGQAAGGARPVAGFSPHRSAPAMRSLSYCRAPPSRVSLRDSPASPPPATDKIHTRARAPSPPRRSGCACMPYL